MAFHGKMSLANAALKRSASSSGCFFLLSRRVTELCVCSQDFCKCGSVYLQDFHCVLTRTLVCARVSMISFYEMRWKRNKMFVLLDFKNFKTI
jgi:hypothetical protein